MSIFKKPLKKLLVNSDDQARLLFIDDGAAPVAADGSTTWTPAEDSFIIEGLTGEFKITPDLQVLSAVSATTKVHKIACVDAVAQVGIIKVDAAATLTGTTTEESTLTLKVRWQNEETQAVEFHNHEYVENSLQVTIPVGITDDAAGNAAVADAIAKAINADPYLPLIARTGFDDSGGGTPSSNDTNLIALYAVVDEGRKNTANTADHPDFSDTAANALGGIKFSVFHENNDGTEPQYFDLTYGSDDYGLVSVASGNDIALADTVTLSASKAERSKNTYEDLKNIFYNTPQDSVEFDRRAEYFPRKGVKYNSYRFKVKVAQDHLGSHFVADQAGVEVEHSFIIYVAQGTDLDTAMDNFATDVNV